MQTVIEYMMDRQGTIEHLALIIGKYHIGCDLLIECNTQCSECCANALYAAGYRLSDNVPVVNPLPPCPLT